ncbi:MAG TPA: glycine cleavage T C-terminal barrel domain-containing protein [Amaricoccus sp.]|nr:glycine cleavage T C-terminal barrel domain-containing protein [Amaricoccus sp.]
MSFPLLRHPDILPRPGRATAKAGRPHTGRRHNSSIFSRQPHLSSGSIRAGAEPIRRDGVIVGRTTSAADGYTVGASVAMGTCRCRRTTGPTGWRAAPSRSRSPASATPPSPRPFYDPENARIRM